MNGWEGVNKDALHNFNVFSEIPLIKAQKSLMTTPGNGDVILKLFNEKGDKVSVIFTETSISLVSEFVDEEEYSFEKEKFEDPLPDKLQQAINKLIL